MQNVDYPIACMRFFCVFCMCASINNHFIARCMELQSFSHVSVPLSLSHCFPLAFSMCFAGLWGLFEWLILMKSNESFEYTSKLFMLCLVLTGEIDGSLIID